MSAHIRLYGEKHILSRETLRMIADVSAIVDPELCDLIGAYLDQEEEDDRIGANPLTALDQLGRDMQGVRLPHARVMHDIWKEGGLMVALAKDWPCDTNCARSALLEVYTLCAQFNDWIDSLNREGCQNGAHCVDELRKRAGQIVGHLEHDFLLNLREI